MSRWPRTLGTMALAAAALAWLDPWQRAREGNRLYAEGKFEDAAGRYNQALVDHPDSVPLHFNLGDALYRQGKYDEALGAFAQVPSGDDDPARTARVAYNAGNAKYRLGEAAEQSDPQKALGLWAEAVAAYRRALGAAPEDTDAKVNHEFVEKKIAELKQKLEEQRKQQEQNQQRQEQDQQQQQDQSQQQDQNQQDQQQGDEEQQQEQQAGREQQQAGDEPPPDPQAGQEQKPEARPDAQPNQSAGGGAREANDGEMSREEATALLDAQRGQEVRPDEVTKRLQGAAVGEPVEDW